MKLIDLILIPLSGLYGLCLSLRHWLFDNALLLSHTPDLPTICVGNLAVGGTGKTPHVEYLVRMLSGEYKIAVLSRGYRRKTHGFVMADARSTAETIGDEPMQLHRKFPDIPVAVCADRMRGVKQLQRMVEGLQVVILDDALQHRSIRCGLNILLTPENRIYIDDHLLPWGRLRDLKHRHLAAQAVIVTKCPENFHPIDKRVIDNRLHLAAYQHLYFSKMVYEPLPSDCKHPMLVSGIAQPEELIAHIKDYCPKVKVMCYGDHHRFTHAECQRIANEAQKHDYVLTTEKDYERLMLTEIPEGLGNKLHVVKIRVDLDIDADPLKEQITQYIHETLRQK